WASQAQRFSKGDRWLRRDDARVAAQSLGKTRTEENVLDLSRRTQRTRRIFKCLCDLGFSRRGSAGWLSCLDSACWLVTGHLSLVTLLAIRLVIAARKGVYRIHSSVSRDRCHCVSRCNGAPCLHRDCS